MSFKLVIFCAAVAAVSCTTIHDRNDQYRDQQQQQQQQQDFDNQQQQQNFDNQRNNNQDQFNRERQFDNFNNDARFNYRQNQNQFNNYPGNFRAYNHQSSNPRIFHLQPAYISIPTSHRNFNVQDDSHYNFGYTVSDVQTGDFKSHQETRQGDKVQGQFSMIDSDGFRRVVDYVVDDVNGFDANVRREPTNAAINFQQQQQFNTNNNNNNFNNDNNNQNAAFFNANHPKSTTSTQVSRVEDGQQTNYATQTTNF